MEFVVKLQFILLWAVYLSVNTSVINTPIVTTFGTWKDDWENCPNGTFVTALDVFTTKINTVRDIKDKTGLLDVVFQCSKLFSDELPAFIFTRVGGVETEVAGFGRAKTNSNAATAETISHIYQFPLRSPCQGVAVGAQLMSDIEQISLDNTAANNIRLYCSDLQNSDQPYVEAYGDYLGTWTQDISCSARTAICGVQTLSQDIDSSLDQSGINALRFKCCKIDNPASLCQPQEHWELIQECNNVENNVPGYCSFPRKVGVSTFSTSADNDDSQREFYEQVGYNLDDSPFTILKALKENFANTIGMSQFSDFLDWGATGLEIWVEQFSEEMTGYLVPDGSSSKVYQLVGTCAHFSVRTPFYKQTT